MIDQFETPIEAIQGLQDRPDSFRKGLFKNVGGFVLDHRMESMADLDMWLFTEGEGMPLDLGSSNYDDAYRTILPTEYLSLASDMYGLLEKVLADSSADSDWHHTLGYWRIQTGDAVDRIDFTHFDPDPVMDCVRPYYKLTIARNPTRTIRDGHILNGARSLNEQTRSTDIFDESVPYRPVAFGPYTAHRGPVSGSAAGTFIEARIDISSGNGAVHSDGGAPMASLRSLAGL